VRFATRPGHGICSYPGYGIYIKPVCGIYIVLSEKCDDASDLYKTTGWGRNNTSLLGVQEVGGAMSQFKGRVAGAVLISTWIFTSGWNGR
jgi:hypothetical protein